MPCNSDYLNPTQRERELQRCAKLYSYALRKLGLTIPAKVTRAANSIYADGCQDFVPDLCALITGLSEQEKATILDSTRMGLDLQLWWEEHKAADRRRIAEEKKAAKLKRTRQEALKKVKAALTPEEMAALGIKTGSNK